MAKKKKGKLNSLLISLDIIGFTIMFIGGILIRFSNQDVFTIIGGFIIAGGVAILSITRLIGK